MSRCGKCDGEGQVRTNGYSFECVVCDTCKGTGDVDAANYQKRIRELEAERDQWQESCGQNYVRAQDAEAREERLREAIERHESGQRKYGTGISYLDQELWAVLKATNGR